MEAGRQTNIYAENNKNTLYNNSHARSRLLVRAYKDQSARLISSSFSRAFYSTFYIHLALVYSPTPYSFDVHVIYVYIQFFNVYIVVCAAPLCRSRFSKFRDYAIHDYAPPWKDQLKRYHPDIFFHVL